MKINLMKKGDRVIAVTNEMIAIEHPNGETDIYVIRIADGQIMIDTKTKLTVGYEDKQENKKTINGVTVYTF